MFWPRPGRDAEGRLVWGVNDVDEAFELPYTQDLVRLATSAILAIRQGHFALAPRDACEAIFDGYRASRERGGRALVLAERRRWHHQCRRTGEHFAEQGGDDNHHGSAWRQYE